MHSIIPHLLLPPLLFLPFYLPPFPFRNIIFGASIIGVVAANIVNTFPDTSALRYGLSGAWIVYFPALEKLLQHPNLERDFWRLDRRPHEAEYMGPFSRDKARWALSLLASLRGVGWSHGSKRVPNGPEKTQSRSRFLFEHVNSAILASLAVEAILIVSDAITIPQEWSFTHLPIIALVNLLMGITVYSTWTIQYSLVATASVVVGLSQPKDWPAIFGSIREINTVSGFWGSFWYGILRQPAMGFSRALVAYLGIPSRTGSAYLIHITTAFFFSSLWHIISIATIAEGRITIPRLIRGLSAFFMGQVLVIMVEQVFSARRRVMHPKKEGGHVTGGEKIEPPSQRGVLGYIGVFTWLGLSGWLFVSVYRTAGLMDTKHPFPVLRPLLGWMGVRV